MKFFEHIDELLEYHNCSILFNTFMTEVQWFALRHEEVKIWSLSIIYLLSHINSEVNFEL